MSKWVMSEWNADILQLHQDSSELVQPLNFVRFSEFVIP